MLIRNGEPGSDLHIDFVPMVDVLFNLLIFFLLATSMAQNEREMSIALPHAAASGPISAAMREIVINIGADGKIDVAGKTVTGEELGAIIVLFKMPDNAKERDDMWWIITSKEVYEANKTTYPSRREEYSYGFAELLEFGMNVTEDQYKQAQKFHEAFKSEFRNLLSNVDALVAPAGGMAKGINDAMWRAKSSEDVIAKYADELELHFGNPANLAGIPSLTLPCGKAENGLPPPGFQLMGAPLTEKMLCRIGYAYEQATGWSKQHPNI